MTYDERLAERIRKVLAKRKGVTEKKMFGGITFMLHGKMCCGVIKNDLIVRIGPEHYEAALAEPHTRPMDFTGRALKGFVFIGPDGHKTGQFLAKWVRQAANYTSSLPTKAKQS